MNIRVLGCHGSDGLDQHATGTQTCNTCGFLLNGRILIDAGTVASRLSLTEQRQIEHVLLSHLHFDHIKGLPALADNLSEQIQSPIIVAGLSDTIDGLHRHIFNSDVYPDFFKIPTTQHPILTSQPLKPGSTYSLSDLDITPILVNHTIPTAGFIVQDDRSAFLYSGDTCPTDELWHEARRLPRLKAAFIECSYPNAMAELARTSKHLTPESFAVELKKLDRPDITVYAYHLKPAYKRQIAEELDRLQIPSVRILKENETLSF